LTTLAEKKNIAWFYVLSLIFILINALFISKELYYFSLLPLLVLILSFAVFALDKLIYIVVFLIPLSIPLKMIIPGLEFDMQLPTEPILCGILILFIFKYLFERNFDNRILYHPVSLVIYLNLIWIFITSITSTMPVVSFKFLASRLWFVVVFYFMATQLFRDHKNIKRFLWFYIIPFLIVIFYAIIQHSSYGFFNQKASNWVVVPFFNDHTSYGAVLAMFLPFLIGFLFMPSYSLRLKYLFGLVLLIFIVATILSYTRAAWISLAGAMVVWMLIRLRIKFSTILLFAGILFAVFFVYRTEIIIDLEKNRQESSKDFAEHIQSISNISSDASNLERINRWNSAFRMFFQKPIFGFGPGTYMFKYAPFQFSYEKTIISTNMGDRGNAHSEYIGPLAESGVLGSLTFILIAFFSLRSGIRLYIRTKKKEIKIISLCALLGLFTYYIHGFLNNFLDTDKASAPFWGFTAIIVALEVYHHNKTERTKEPATSD